MKKIRMYMGIPSNGNVVDFQGYMLRELQRRYADEIEFVFPKDCYQRIFHDYARNEIVEEFMASGCDVLWFLDSDVVSQPHVLDLITLHWDKWVVAGAPYPVFMSQPGEQMRQIVYTVYKGNNGVGMHPSTVPYSGVDYVDGMATGCLFIKREVFEKLKKPYFEFKFDPETRRMNQGEDLGFCIKLSELGIKVFTDYSMVCKHYKTVDLTELNNYAITFANKAVKAYDSQIRGQIEQLKERLQARPAPRPASGLILPDHLRK